MTTLTEFLLARLSEDEAVAREATAGPWRGWLGDGVVLPDGQAVLAGGGVEVVAEWMASAPDVAHIARHDPARVLADVEAKRAIVERWHRALPDWDGHLHLADDAALLFSLLALPYADHPSYDESWRP